jgi:hypothetical protein
MADLLCFGQRLLLLLLLLLGPAGYVEGNASSINSDGAVHRLQGGCSGRSASLQPHDCAAWQNFTHTPLYMAWAEAKCGVKVHTDPCSCQFADQTQCNNNGRITHLNMFGTELPGSAGVPLSLLELTGLTSLHLGGNSLIGTVPAAALGRLQQLTLLGLEGNNLTGPIPPALGQLEQLVALALGNNALTGTVPQELLALKKLTLIDIFTIPHLTGRLPAFNFSQFTQCCAMNGDSFTCPLPRGASTCVGGPGCSPNKFPPPTCK